ncbi:MAG TPA: HEAT repeat domain-containing protein [Gemmataceae bacterium]|nr:HEAT repeat domain-containing protein [Gemmataceae bacterium]
MKRKRVILTVVVLTIAVGAAAVTLDPAARVHGWAGGEPFHDGKSATGWRRELRKKDEVAPAAAVKTLADAKAAGVCGWLLEKAPESAVRRRAADSLAQMGKDAAPAAPSLVKALADADPLVRGVAARAVGELAPDAPGAVPALVKQFPDVDAIRAVAKFKAAGAEAVPELTKLLTHEDGMVRWQALRTLGKIGEPSLPTLPKIIEMMGGDPNPLVREHAAEAAGDIGPAAKDAVPALAKAMKDPEHKVRRDAVRSLGQIGPAAAPVLADVKALMKDDEEIVREAATRAARLIDPSGK